MNVAVMKTVTDEMDTAITIVITEEWLSPVDAVPCSSNSLLL